MRTDTIETFLEQLAARVPAPGGGATAALHAAQAAALVAMVARYSDSARYADHAEEIATITSTADRLRVNALGLAEEDAAAFTAVTEAYRLPKGTPDEAAARSAAIATSRVAAARVPAVVVAVAEQVLGLAEELLPIGNRNVVSDVAAAAEAARAAATTARVQVEINLGRIKDPATWVELAAGGHNRRRPGTTGEEGHRPRPRGGGQRRRRRRGGGPGRGHDGPGQRGDQPRRHQGPGDLGRARGGRRHRRRPGPARGEGHRRRPGRAGPMTATLSGTELAAGIRAEVAAAAAELAAAGTPPRLAVVVATAGESSAWYVRSIARAAEKVGIACSVVDLGESATPDRIRAELAALSRDPAVHGIILQTPLPADAVFEDLAASIDPAKDVDGANPLSLGRLAAGLPAFAPATAAAVLALLDHNGIPLSGAHAVVVGRSNVRSEEHTSELQSR